MPILRSLASHSFPVWALAPLAALTACSASVAPAGPQTPAVATSSVADEAAPPNRISHEGRELYLSGFNIAWFDFARDVGKGGIDETRLRQAIAELVAAGGNTMRWWIHTDGSTSPVWGSVDGRRLVTGPGASFIGDLRRALDIARESHVYIVPCLWSFDMLRDNADRHPPVQDNYRLLTDDTVLESYIGNVLEPMVRELNGHPALIAWELFNEPENMTEDWFKRDKAFYGGPVPTLQNLQHTQGKLAAAIHRVALAQHQTALVTTGSKSLGKYTSDVAGRSNLYRDDRLVAAAGGDPLATLDFYEPHYYDNEGDKGAWSPFHHRASYWHVDKPIVIGEFQSEKPLELLGERIETKDLCQRLVDYGYAGGWPWQWNEHAEPIRVCLQGVRGVAPSVEPPNR